MVSFSHKKLNLCICLQIAFMLPKRLVLVMVLLHFTVSPNIIRHLAPNPKIQAHLQNVPLLSNRLVHGIREG